MVLTLAPFSGVNVTSKIALWETRAKRQDSPAPMRAASRPEPSRIARSDAASPFSIKVAPPLSPSSLPSLSPQSSHSPPPIPQIGEICYARICYYVAETQEASPSVELAGVPPSTVSLVTKSKSSAESSEFKESSLPFETLALAPSSDWSTSPSSSFTTSAPFSESAASSPSPSSATSLLSTEAIKTSEPLDALHLEGVEPIFDFPVAAPLSDLLWQQ